MQVREIEGKICVVLPYGKSNEVSCIFSCGVTILIDPHWACSVALCWRDITADLRSDCCFTWASLPRLLANVSTDCTAEIICRWLNIVSFILLTVVILNTCETEPIESYCIFHLLIKQWDNLQGVVMGYAPLLACSVVCLKGSSHFTDCRFDFPCSGICSVCSDQCATRWLLLGSAIESPCSNYPVLPISWNKSFFYCILCYCEPFAMYTLVVSTILVLWNKIIWTSLMSFLFFSGFFAIIIYLLK